MKKRMFAVGLIAVMSAFTVVGCGGSSMEDYEHDVKQIEGLQEKAENMELGDDIDAMMDAIEGFVDDTDMKTSEGQDFIDAYGNVLDFTGEMLEVVYSGDEAALEEKTEEYKQYTKELSETATAFKDAAVEAGMKEAALEALNGIEEMAGVAQ